MYPFFANLQYFSNSFLHAICFFNIFGFVTYDAKTDTELRSVNTERDRGLKVVYTERESERGTRF